MDDSSFEKLANATLKGLMAAIEDALPDAIEDIDLQGSVLTIELAAGGTYVVNKHAANQEIWLSSPKSGAAHFAFDPASGEWRSTRGGADLHARLGAELGEVAGMSLTLTPAGREG
jgi:frataxin